MKKILPLCMFLGLMIGGLTATASEKTLNVAALDWKPYLGDNGYMADIAKEAMEQAGYQIVYTVYPWEQAFPLLVTGEVDGMLGSYYSEGKLGTHAFAQPVIQVRENFFHLKGKEISYSALKDLEPYTIGVFGGSDIETSLKRSNLKTEAVEDQRQNLEKLLEGSVDLIIGPTEEILHILNTNFPDVNKNQLSMLSPAYQQNDVYLAFSKQHPQHEKLVEEFNKGLNLIRSNGKYDEILKRHGITE